MSPAAEVALVAARELRKNVRSAKGIVLLAMSILGGTSVALLFTFVTGAIKAQATAQGGDAAIDAAQLAPALIAVVGLVRILGLTVWLTPLLVALLGFDALSGELQHRAVRYWTIRTRRASFYVGKVLGLWLVVAGVTFVMDLLVWVVFLFNEKTPAEILKVGPLLWLASLPISLVWCAMTTLVSSLFKQPMLALLVTFASFFGLWVLWFAGTVSHVDALAYPYPNFYEEWMLTGEPKRVVGAVAILFAWAAAYTGGGAALFARRDV